MSTHLTDDEMLAVFEEHFLAIESEEDRAHIIAGLRAVASAQIEKDATVIAEMERAWVTPEGTKVRKLDAMAAIRAQTP